MSLIANFINEDIDKLFTNSEKKHTSNIMPNSNNELVNLVVNNDKIREFLELYMNYGNERVLNSFIEKLKELKKISENI